MFGRNSLRPDFLLVRQKLQLCGGGGGGGGGGSGSGRRHLMFWFFPAATPRPTFTTGGLNQVRASGVICASTPEDLTQDRPAWRRFVKTGSAIYEANWFAAAKAKRAARKSPAPRTNTANAQALPTCPRCQCVFRARISLVGHPRTQCTNNLTIPTSTSNSVNPPSDLLILTPVINSITPTIIESTTQGSSPVTPSTETTTAFAFTTTTTIRDGDSLLNGLQCDRTFISRIYQVGHSRIHCTETGEPLPGAPSHSRDRRLHCPHCPRAFTHRIGLFGHMRIHNSGINHNADNTDTPCTPSEPLPGAPSHSRDRRLHCPHCPRAFTHRMGLFGHKRIHDSGIHHNADNTDTQCAPSAPAIRSAPDTLTTMNDIPPVSTDFSCPQCARNFNSRIGLVDHL
ncbi:unnamed protein product [Schistocephalus solidus]|uniref:C2H2-type domain-containing protein n=1 Tax=Schistocephalus solidus TaxID=70667 RepID=A0A183T2D8_SCHSO|nr:unnamed protein product [Schistocephalus solidus]